MSAITKPSAPGWANVTARYHKVKARNVSPFSGVSQAYVWSGENWSFTFTLPPLKDPTVALSWITFLYDLAKADNYFVCNVAPYTPAAVGTVSGAARNVNLRLTSPDASWDVNTAKMFGITFEAEIDQ
jgi:hypothetical protein